MYCSQHIRASSRKLDLPLGDVAFINLSNPWVFATNRKISTNWSSFFKAVPLSLENKNDWNCHEFLLLLFSSYFTLILNPWVFQNVEFAIPHYLNGGQGPVDKWPAEEQCPNSYNDPDIEGPWFPSTYFLTGEFLSKKLCYCGLDSLECGTVPRESHCALGTSYRALHEAQNQKYYCIDEEAEGTTVEQQHRSVTTCTAHTRQLLLSSRSVWH